MCQRLGSSETGVSLRSSRTTHLEMLVHDLAPPEIAVEEVYH